MNLIKEQPTVQLKNAVHSEVLMPVVGLGTGGYGRPDGSGGEYWGPEQGHNAVVTWLKIGGRRIDTSDDYGSRDGIGTGWKAGGVPRSEIFITSKVDPSGYDKGLEEFDGILKSLQTDYVDLLLIHWPGSPPQSSKPIPPCKEGQSTWTECRIQTWRALETIFKEKRVRYFSRFYWSQIVNIHNSRCTLKQHSSHLKINWNTILFSRLVLLV